MPRDINRTALLERMVGARGQEHLSLTEQLLLVTQRWHNLTTGAEQSPCKFRFYNFLSHCVWTIDEARSGEVRKWPTGLGEDGKSWDRLWLEMEDSYLRSKLLMVEKARRVLASWFTCAFDIWLAAGGQDPRWVDEKGFPTLLRSDCNRKIIVQARKAEGEAGSEWFVAERIKPILEAFEARGGREWWPDFPGWSHTCGKIEFSNGSKIVGVPQGADQVRGSGITQIHGEEAAFWEQAKKTIGAAIPTLRGGGHLVLITTPAVGTHAKDIRDGKV